MAVKIPTIERIAPIAPGSQGRIQTQAIDVATPFSKVAGAVEKTAGQVINYLADEEDNAINTHTNALANQLDEFANTKLYGNSQTGTKGLAHLRGDPTDAYNNFDAELAEKRDSLTASAQLSDRGKRQVTGALMNRYNSIYNKRLTLYGSQVARYDEESTNTSVKLRQRDTSDALAYYTVSDPNSIAPFKQSLDDIRGLRIKNAIGNGTAPETSENAKGEKWSIEEEDGTKRYYTLNESVKFQIAEDINKAVYNSIDAAIKAGQVNKAEQLMKDFKDQIFPDKRGKLEEALYDKSIEQGGKKVLADLDDVPIKKRAPKLRAMKTNSPKQAAIKLEARKQLDANDRFRENEKKRASTSTYNQLANQFDPLTDPNRAGARFVDNSVALENTVVTVDGVTAPAKHFIGDITDTKQRQALFAMVEKRPKTGDDTAFGELMDKGRTGGIVNMPFPQLQEESAGLSEKQFNTVKGVWKQQNTEGAPGETSRTRMLLNRTEQELLRNGVIKKNRFGKYSRANQKILNDVNSKAIDEYSVNITKGTTTKEINDVAKEIVVEKQRELDDDGGGFFSGLTNLFGGGDEAAPVETAPVIKGAYDALEGNAKIKAITDFRKANPGVSPTTPVVREWYEKRQDANK